MKSENAAGYSGTPLARKLGIKDAQVILLINAPKDYERLLAPMPPGIVFADKPTSSVDLAHLFVLQQEDLIKHLRILRKKLKPDAVVWVSWPKKSAKVATTVTEDTIRDAALPLGFVDIKVCAVTEVWSGLKLVVRKALR
jgi:Protein of unknown function (DUF3052)